MLRCHSPGLHGYEFALYKGLDNETDAWEEVTDLEDFKIISGGKAFKFVNVKLQIKKLDASLSVLVEYGWICEKICFQEYLHGYSRSARCTLK